MRDFVNPELSNNRADPRRARIVFRRPHRPDVVFRVLRHGTKLEQGKSRVVLPNSLPYIIVGLRLAIGRAILGVVVGEFFGSSKGLGFMIASAASNYKVDVVFAGVAIFMGLSLILTLSVKKLENSLARWRPEAAKNF